MEPNHSGHKRPHALGFLAIFLGALMIIVAIVVPGSQGGKSPGGIAFAADTATADMLSSPFKGIYEQVSPAVVGISITSGTSIFGGRISMETTHAGSGVVIGEEGYVVTNYHVVEGAEGVYVVHGEDAYAAEYIAGDQEADIAVLLVAGKNLPSAKVGDSDQLSVGDWALVIGNPLGEQFANTLTVGVISGLGRDLSENRQGTRSRATSLIQTNAAINAGNSGGGLFNITGELVGITSMKLSNNGYYGYASIEGIGFAIPMNTVKQIVSDLIAYGRVRYPRIGITMRDITSPSMEPTADMLPRSVWVTEVEKGLPGDLAGLRVDDLIVEVDGQRVTTSFEVQNAVRAHQEGETAELLVYRVPGLRQIKVDEKFPEGEYVKIAVEIRVVE